MAFEFQRPVYTGETIACTCTFDVVDEHSDRYDLVIDFTCERRGDVVLTGTIDGIVWTSI